jgi:DNA-binding GntR family transcriptional regulator
VSTEQLNKRARVALAKALSRGELRAGQFASMPQLAETLELPLAAVRDATLFASTLGWLDIIPKRGVQIVEPYGEVIAASLDMRMVLDQEGARRIIRCAAPPDELQLIRSEHERILDALDHAKGLSAQAIKVDLSLHDFLASGLDNQFLKASYDSNWVRIAIFQQVRPFVQERIRSAMIEHLAIIDAIEHRNEDAATEAIALHCDRTRHWWGV